ncbi:MAG: nitroreductase family deazaflavin-dependent oxidoreductase [Anaerolineales bacterium]|nr:nitroreductase family deazaflavin-dependent oxidoreductase [Anaerolineales bacterium]
MSNPNDFNQQVIDEFRANEGQVGGYFANSTLLLLHSTGAKSGQPRLNPLVTMPVGDDYVIIASKGGAPTNPDWYYNLVANPEAEIEVGAERFPVRARLAEEPERTLLYQQVAAQFPAFAEYEKKAGRTIPVFVLNRV